MPAARRLLADRLATVTLRACWGGLGVVLIALVVSAGAIAQDAKVRFDSGTAGPSLRAISGKLAALGFYRGASTEAFSPALGRAIKAYRDAAGLPAGDYADQELLNRLQFGATVAPIDPKLAGRARPELREAQRKLTMLGFYDGAIDGVEGPRTHAAVAAYQGKNGLAVTGRLTPELMTQLAAAKPGG